jgi:HlyD family secretion protein
MRPKKRLIISLAVVAVLLGAGGLYYFRASAAARAQQAAPLQTAQVTVGSITISASGSAELIAQQTADLAFDANGTLTEIDVQIGDKVKAGQVLARIDDTAAKNALQQAQLNLASLTSPQAMANAQLALANAQDALKTANYNEWVLQQGHRASSATIKNAEAALVLAQNALSNAQKTYGKVKGNSSSSTNKAAAYTKLYQAMQARDSALRTLNWLTGSPTDIQQAQLEGQVLVAEANVASAQALVDILSGKTSDVADVANPSSDLMSLRQAKLDVQTAQDNLNATTLTAPFDGTIMAVNANVGESAPNPVITITDIAHPIVDMTLDESDLDKAVVGNAIQVSLDAYPDLSLTGKITRVDPALVAVQGVQTVHAIGALDDASLQQVASLPYGLTASVDVIAASARNVLLVPVEALHQLSAGQYGVFVMKNGQPTLQVVEVGLQTPVYAEIKSGLQAGEVVTTGVVQSP